MMKKLKELEKLSSGGNKYVIKKHQKSPTVLGHRVFWIVNLKNPSINKGKQKPKKMLKFTKFVYEVVPRGHRNK